MSPITEIQIAERAERIVNATAAKHGVAPDTFTATQREDARQAARAELEYESDPHVQALQAANEENRQLKAQLAALQTRGAVSAPSGKAPFNAEIVRGRLGSAFYGMSNNQKIAAAGEDPSRVDLVELKRLFGRGADTQSALDYSRQNGADYARKRELAKLLDIYGG